MGEQYIPAEQPDSDLSDVFPGQEHRTILVVTKLIGDGSQLVSGGTYARSIVVADPRYNFKSLVIEQSIVYGSTSRSTLAANKPFHRPVTESVPGCRNSVGRLWRLRESELRTFSRGQQILVTNWVRRPWPASLRQSGALRDIRATPSWVIRHVQALVNHS